MKFINKLLMVLPVVFLVSGAIDPSLFNSIVTDKIYGPFLGDEDVEVYFYHYSYKNYTCKVNEYYLDSGSRFGISSCTIGPKNGDESTPIYIFAKDRMNSGIRLDFSFSNGKEYSVALKKPTHTVINASRQADQNVVISDRVLYMDKEGMHTEEVISFSNLNEYISTNSDNSLDFSELNFSHSSNIACTYSKAYLKIYDYKNVFPHLSPAPFSNTKNIPLELSQIDGVVQLKCKSNLYVDSSTLQMYETRWTGRVHTNELFIPIGGEEKMSNTELEIVIENFGADESMITIPLQYYDYRHLFGLCHEADYCISGGVKK